MIAEALRLDAEGKDGMVDLRRDATVRKKVSDRARSKLDICLLERDLHLRKEEERLQAEVAERRTRATDLVWPPRYIAYCRCWCPSPPVVLSCTLLSPSLSPSLLISLVLSLAPRVLHSLFSGAFLPDATYRPSRDRSASRFKSSDSAAS